MATICETFTVLQNARHYRSMSVQPETNEDLVYYSS